MMFCSIKNNVVRNSPANEKEDKSSVYLVLCKNCGLVYIGETCKLLCSCLKQHKNSCRRSCNSNATTNHSHNLDLAIDFNEPKIVLATVTRDSAELLRWQSLSL